MTCPSDLHPCTTAARHGVNNDPAHGAVMPPIYLSSNYSFDGLDGKRRYDYTRSGNPTRDVLGETLARLEGGCGAVVTATGMAAVDLALFSLEPGDLLIAPHDLYGATPSNPLMRVVDVAALCARAHSVGCKAAVDNTFLSPALQQPLSLGADLVIHSTTKYINGHSDVVGGCVVAKDPADLERLTWWANCLGVTGSPFDAYLTLRGVRTLFARIERQQATAGRIADWLLAQPAVRAVHYPGLTSHPGHATAARQQSGFGAMLSFELHDIAGVRALVDRLEVFTLAESLGGVESLIAHPALMTHAAMTPEARRTAGITDGLLRLSIGLEHPEDLLADLAQALEAVPVPLAAEAA
jgi:cystathionine gamma-synthase